MQQGWNWLSRNKWILVACGFMAINLYGVLRLRSPILEPTPPAIEPAPPALEIEPARPERLPVTESPPSHPPSLSVSGFSVQTPSMEETVLDIRLSDEVKADDLRRMLSLDPSADIVVSTQHQRWRGHYALVRGPLRKGHSYTLTIDGGLRNASGTAGLGDSFVRTFRVPDAVPSMRIRHPGRYLSPAGAMRLPLRSVNVDRYRIEAHRIAPRNLVQYAMREGGHYSGYYYGRPADKLGTLAGKLALTLEAGHNEIVESSADLREMLPADPTGAYVIRVARDERTMDERLLVVTDTGISIKRSPETLLVWANSIRTLDAVTGAVVQVWSPTAELLVEGITDSVGLAQLDLNPEALEEPFLVSVMRGTDLSFLSLDEARRGTAAGADGAGDYRTAGYEAYVYTDRGVYRPGETARIQAVVRGPHLVMPNVFPVDLAIFRPDGRPHSRRQAMLSDSGTAAFAVDWQDFDATGRYRLELRTPGSETALGQGTLLVEEFVPPRLAVDVSGDKAVYRRGDRIRLSVDARYLYGAPASGNPVRARLSVQPADFRPAGFDDFVFGDAEKIARFEDREAGSGRLDGKGQASFTVSIPDHWTPPSMLKGLLAAEVGEQGGRTVNAYASCEIHPYPFYIGLLAQGLGRLRPDDEARFEIVAVAPDGKPLGDIPTLEIEMDRLSWSTVLTEDSRGRVRYESRMQHSTVRQATLQPDADGRAEWRARPPAGGTYRVTVRDPDSGSSASMRFTVGGAHDHWQSRALDRPGTLELQLDRERYRPGDTARLTVTAPFAGKALLTVEQDRVRYHAVQHVTVNTAVFEIPVTSNLWPNAHATVQVIREVGPAHMPQVYRAAGSVPLQLDDAHARLAIELQAPERIRPLERLDIAIAVTGPGGEPRLAEITVAAVDEGICMLTGFQTPDPLAWFSRLRQRGVLDYDLYTLLMPETDETADTVRSHTGGDLAALLRGRLNPIRSRRFKPVALWQGSRMTDSHGHARVVFEVPEFSGSLRIMAVAVADGAFGSANTHVRVTRPLTVLASLPRFLAPGDTCRLPVELHYTGEQAVEARVEIVAKGPVRIEPEGTVSVPVKAGGRASLDYNLSALNAAGKAVITIRAQVGDENFEERIELPVRPGSPRSARHETLVVASGETQAVTFPAGMLSGSERYRVRVSSRPEVRYSGAIEYLVNYPYGCLEQTVSTAIPLLYLQAASGSGAFYVGDTGPMVEHGISRTLAMQRADGSFAYWPAGTDVYAWGTAYALDFLLQARTAGYAVPADRLDAGAGALNRYLSRPMAAPDRVGSPAWQYDAAVRAYACQVLAQAGKPRHDWTARLLEQVEHLGIDTRWRLVLALAEGGRRRDAWELLERIAATPVPDDRELGGALVSPVRTAALRVLAWLALAPEDTRTIAAAEALGRQLDKQGWYTTQDSGMALMALARYRAALPGDDPGFNGLIEQGGIGIPVSSDDGAAVHDLPDGQPLRIVNHGPGQMVVAWTASGIPIKPLPPVDSGLILRREYQTLDGAPLSEQNVRQGDLIRVQLSVVALDTAEHLVIEDLLPAGLEIENANLATARRTGQTENRNAMPVRHVDIRDDRLVIFPGEFRGTRTFTYTARAVTPGRYLLPHAGVEEMYDPGVLSRNGAGRFIVEDM